MYDDKGQHLERVVLEYLESLGCRTGADRGGVPYVLFHRGTAPLKSLAVEFGPKASLREPGLLRRLTDTVISAGSWSHVGLQVGLTDSELLDICSRHAESLGLGQPPEAVLRVYRPRRQLLLTAFVASLFTHARTDRLLCFAGGPGLSTRRVPLCKVSSVLEARGVGWLSASPAVSFEPLGWVPQSAAEAASHANTVTRGLLWRAGRLSRALMAEEIRLIEVHYSDLSHEALEPLRRLHMRISEVNERRSDTRSMRTAQATAAEFRRLKGQMGQEESHLEESRNELARERDDRIEEARRRYAPKARVELRLASVIDVEVPVLAVDAACGFDMGFRLVFDPFEGLPRTLEWGGEALPVHEDSRFVACNKGHIHDVSRASQCACGRRAVHARGCARCGAMVCDACLTEPGLVHGPLCSLCRAEEELEDRAFHVLN